MLPDLVNYTVFPIVATIAGAGVALVRPPDPMLRSCIQHFAAGVVFSVVSVELLPDVIKKHAPFFVVLGFVLGVTSMLLIRSLTGKLKSRAQPGERALPVALILAVSVDVLLDGFLIGIGFAAGAKEGVLLTAALTLELLSLGLAMAIQLTDAGLAHRKTMTTVSAIALLILIGTAIGTLVLSRCPDVILETVLSFGLVALLFLVTEELLTEAHEQPETPITTTAFFVGFLLFLILGMLS